jgi:hypothetical protein
MTTYFLWAGTGFIALVLVYLIVRDIRFRTGGRMIDAVGRVSGYREANDDDGFTTYYNKVTYTDQRGATHEISAGFASRTPPPIGTQIPIRYPEDRPHMGRERDGGCGTFFVYAVAVTMLLAFGTAALLGFGEGIDR